jgi:hypothetical protein
MTIKALKERINALTDAPHARHRTPYSSAIATYFNCASKH